MLKYKINVTPKIDAFRDSYFVRTVSQWNQLPLCIREIVHLDTFTIALKNHLWRILGFEPD